MARSAKAMLKGRVGLGGGSSSGWSFYVQVSRAIEKQASRKINQIISIKKKHKTGCWLRRSEISFGSRWRRRGIFRRDLEPPLLDGVSGDITDRWRLWAAAPVSGATEQQMSDVAVSNGKQA